MPRTILLLGNYRPALAVARSLAEDGHRILVSSDAGAGAAERSRAVSGMWKTPQDTSPAALYASLADFLQENPDIDTVFPLMESYVRGFPDHAHLLPADRLYVMPNSEAVRICLDKARLLQAVTDAGLPCARNLPVHDLASLQGAAGAIGFPLVIKPSDSTVWLGNRKALILNDQEALNAALPKWPDGHGELIVQTFVDGPRVNLYFAAQNGRAIRYLAVQIGETDIADGTGLATTGFTIEPEPAVRDMADALLARLNYHGVGCIQVLCDRNTGQPSFLEINPRIGGNHAITVFAEMELERVALQLAVGGPVEDTLKIGRSGIRYAWTTGALRGVGLALRNGETSRTAAMRAALKALVTGVTTRRHITFTPGDPVPSLTLFARLVPGLNRIL